jgi:hypothetical protein
VNYAQAYVNLIGKAKQRSTTGLDPRQKHEQHHYFPVCFWRNKKENIKTVFLTLREHWVAHRLLFKMFPGKGTATALLFMSKRDPKMNSRKFESIRRVTSEHNWTKTAEGRAFLSRQMKQRIADGWTCPDAARQKLSEIAKRTQEKWKEEDNHPLSSSKARVASSERAKLRNKEMNVWLNKEKGKVIRICDKCAAQVRGSMGNMKQHQRSGKCIAKSCD